MPFTACLSRPHPTSHPPHWNPLLPAVSPSRIQRGFHCRNVGVWADKSTHVVPEGTAAPSGQWRQVKQECPRARQRRRIVVPSPSPPLTAPTNPHCCASEGGNCCPHFDSAGGWIDCTIEVAPSGEREPPQQPQPHLFETSIAFTTLGVRVHASMVCVFGDM